MLDEDVGDVIATEQGQRFGQVCGTEHPQAVTQHVASLVGSRYRPRRGAGQRATRPRQRVSDYGSLMRAERALSSSILPALLLTAVMVLTGCGSGTSPVATPTEGSQPPPSKADVACQAQFTRAANAIGDTPRKGYAVPIAFASRWSSVQNGLTYYATDAKAADCTDVLPQMQQQVKELTTLTASLAPYDVRARALSAQAGLGAWKATHSGKRLRRQVTTVTKVVKAVVKAAPAAAQDVNPALLQLASIDPSDTTAIAKAKKDLALLASTSQQFQICKAGLAYLAKVGLQS